MNSLLKARVFITWRGKTVFPPVVFVKKHVFYAILYYDTSKTPIVLGEARTLAIGDGVGVRRLRITHPARLEA
jgi:hypothetical protein